MKAIIAIIGVGSAALLLFLGAEVMSNDVDVWAVVQSIPKQFVRYVSRSFSHDMLLTALVIVGVLAAIAYIRHVPPAKVR